MVAALGSGALTGCLRLTGSSSESSPDEEEDTVAPTETTSENPTERTTGNDGSYVWQMRAGAPLSRPAVDAERVYVGSVDQTFYALDRTTGERVWTLERDAEFTAPIVVGETVYTEVGGSLLRLDPTSGEVIGESKSAGTFLITEELVLIDQTVISSGASGYIALDQVGGTELWRSDLGGRYGPVIGDDIVVFGSVYDTASEGRSKETEVHALDIETGEEVWSLQRDALAEESVDVASAVHDGIVGIVIDTGIVYGVDAGDGTVLWETETSHRRDPNRGGNDIPTPIVFDDQFVICSEEVQALDVETGERNWTVGSRLPEIRTIPPVIDGAVYYPTANDSGEYGGILGVTADGEITAEVDIPTPFETLPAVGREQQYYISHSDATLRKYENNN